MNLKSSNNVATNQYALELEVSPEELDKAVAEVYKKESRRMSIPGFRKGKAPRSFIEKMYGEGFFYEDAVNSLYPAAYSAAVDEAGIVPVDRADVEITEVSREKGVALKATVTVKPEVEVSNYKNIAAAKRKVEITDKDIDAELKRMQERNARMVDVDDRPVEKGDNVIIDFTGYVDGETFEGGSAEKFPLTIGSNQFIPGFEDQVIGHKVGEEFEITVTFPEDYQAKELQGQSTVFKINLHEIKTRELPEVDDEFVKDVSEFDTLDELKADLSKKLAERGERAAQEEFENQLIDTVIGNMTAEIPQCMIENNIDEMVQNFEYRLQMQGLDLNTYLQYTGMDAEAFRKTFAEQAEKQVKIRLALEKIGQMENLDASEEEINAKYEELAKNYNMELDRVKLLIAAADVKMDVISQKAIDLVRDTAIVTEAKEEPSDSSAEESK